MEKKPAILVIDDDNVIRLACQKTLEAEGMDVDTAINGKIGLDKIKAKNYDLVLLDLIMPEMTGNELLTAVRELDKEVIIIVITGFATIESAVETLQQGAYDYVSKPFTPEELRKVVRKGLERARLLTEARGLRKEREENLQALAAEQSRLKTIINCMGEGLIATDQNAKLILINSIACKLLNIDEPGDIGHPIRGYLNCSELEDWICKTLEKEKITKRYQNREIVFDADAEKTYSVTMAPLTGADENFSGLALVLMDISEEKKLEKRKEEFQKLVAVVTHELKAPINAIENYLDVIINGYVKDKPEKQHEYLTRSRDKAEMLRNLIHDLLSLTSIESGKITNKMSPIDIRPIITEIIGFMEHEASQKEVIIEWNLPEKLPLISGDKNSLNIVFSNLISNAIKYNRKGGTVTIKHKIEDSFLVISVNDTGFGIADDELDKIFNEFYRSKSDAIQNISGTGIGLNITKRIVELHNGKITVASELNKGSQFKVFLPILS
jgi:signal transduction histidine kinase